MIIAIHSRRWMDKNAIKIINGVCPASEAIQLPLIDLKIPSKIMPITENTAKSIETTNLFILPLISDFSSDLDLHLSFHFLFSNSFYWQI